MVLVNIIIFEFFQGNELTLNPHELIVPIFAIRGNNEISQFLGTGSFIGAPPLLLTAQHVIADWPEKLAISTVKDLNKLYFVTVVMTDKDHDLALLSVDGYSPSSSLQLAENLIPQNQLLANFEYGTTRSESGKIIISPATRIGNITRVLDMTDKYKGAGNEMLELSFSALKGASGSPVVSNDDKFELLGVIIANVSYHLLPAQLSSVLDADNQLIEETSFMLPQALAVNVKHVKELLNRYNEGLATTVT